MVFNSMESAKRRRFFFITVKTVMKRLVQSFALFSVRICNLPEKTLKITPERHTLVFIISFSDSQIFRWWLENSCLYIVIILRREKSNFVWIIVIVYKNLKVAVVVRSRLILKKKGKCSWKRKRTLSVHFPYNINKDESIAWTEILCWLEDLMVTIYVNIYF